MASKITKELAHLATPIGDVSNWRGNPRKGDVEAVMRSYDTFGQRKPIVARKVRRSDGSETGEVIAGNHQLMAARRLGWAEIAVVWVDDDDTTASSYAVADNRISDIGSYDNELLREAISRFKDSSKLLLAASCESLVAGAEETDAQIENIKSTQSVKESKDKYDNRSTRTFMAELPVDIYDWVQDRLREKKMSMCGCTTAQALIEITKDACGD